MTSESLPPTIPPLRVFVEDEFHAFLRDCDVDSLVRFEPLEAIVDEDVSRKWNIDLILYIAKKQKNPNWVQLTHGLMEFSASPKHFRELRLIMEFRDESVKFSLSALMTEFNKRRKAEDVSLKTVLSTVVSTVDGPTATLQ